MNIRAPASGNENVAAHSPLTKVLHFAVAASVIHQLVISQVMRPPTETAAGDLGWRAHEVVGLVSLGLLFLFWSWTMIRRGETPADRLWPWFSAGARRSLLRDVGDHLRAARGLRLPPPNDSPMAAAMHGLGILTASAMALTGMISMLSDLLPSELIAADLTAHSAVAKLMWAYLVAHAAIALLHETAGHRLLRGMFLPPATDPSRESA